MEAVNMSFCEWAHYDDDLKPWQCLDEQLLLGVVDVISHPAKVWNQWRDSLVIGEGQIVTKSWSKKARLVHLKNKICSFPPWSNQLDQSRHLLLVGHNSLLSFNFQPWTSKFIWRFFGLRSFLPWYFCLHPWPQWPAWGGHCPLHILSWRPHPVDKILANAHLS